MENSKKIALLTIHHTTNFGSALQTYGLYKTVQKLGYRIDVLDYRCDAIENREFLNIDIRKPKSIYRHFKYGKSLREKSEAFKKFLQSYATLSDVYTIENVEDANQIYDTFLVGSDIVWGLNVTGNDLTYFLDFVYDNKKKIAFASSAGFKWNAEFIPKIAALLNRFEAIGVRESIVAEWIEEIADRSPDVVVDPTMLWEVEEWDKMAQKPQISEEYILVYFCDEQEKILQDAKEFGEKKNLPVYYINYGKKSRGIHSIKPNTIEEFLGLVKHAKYVYSASFHGLLFSLYFEKEVLFYNRANFSRMQSLAKWLGIEGRNGMEVKMEEAEKINYVEVTKKIETKREESLVKLKTYLS